MPAFFLLSERFLIPPGDFPSLSLIAPAKMRDFMSVVLYEL